MRLLHEVARSAPVIVLMVICIVVLLTMGCTDIKVLQVEECEFYVSEETPAVITWDDLLLCGENIQVTMVSWDA